MINIAVVDGELEACNTLKSSLDLFKNKINEEFNIEIFNDPQIFLMHFDSQYNLIFLDIEMDKINGIECGKAIRKIDKSVIIIFVSNAAKYAIQGYEVEALDYIVKPINNEVFFLKMERALKRIAKRKDANIVIKTKDGVQNLQISHIKYLEVEGHYCIYHTYFGEFKIYQTLSNELKKLPSSQFAKCNRNCVVNLRYVECVKDDAVIIDKEKLYISRPQKKKFLECLYKYIEGNI